MKFFQINVNIATCSPNEYVSQDKKSCIEYSSLPSDRFDENNSCVLGPLCTIRDDIIDETPDYIVYNVPYSHHCYGSIHGNNKSGGLPGEYSGVSGNHGMGKLNSPQAWSAIKTDPYKTDNTWIQFDLGTDYELSGVAIQKRKDAPQYATEIKIETKSSSASELSLFTNNYLVNGESKSGNSDGTIDLSSEYDLSDSEKLCTCYLIPHAKQDM